MNEVEFTEEVAKQMKSAETRLTKLETVAEYVLTLNETVASQEKMGNPESRRKLFVQGTFGKLHLDFVYVGEDKANGQLLFSFPRGTPLPRGLIEVQTFDGGTIWVRDNGDTVRGGKLTTGTRYIIDLIGFWRV